MDRGDSQSSVLCKLCGEAFTVREDEVEENLPRVLLCGHIYCTSCLLSIQRDGIIRCPDCEVDLTIPEGGVYGLQEDSRIIGLIYTAKMNKMKSLHCNRSKNRKRNKLQASTGITTNIGHMEQPADIKKFDKAVDEALVRAAENLAQLERIHETLKTGLAKQVKKERAQLEIQIKEATCKALQAIQKWKEMQLNQLTKLESLFSTSQAGMCKVQERMKALEIAMQMAREVRRVPFLEQYCTLDKVLETLQTPVDRQDFDIKSTTVGSGMRCVFHSESLTQSLSLSMTMEIDGKWLSPPQPDSSTRKSLRQRAEGSDNKSVSSSHKRLPSPQKPELQSAGASRSSSRGPSPRPRQKIDLRGHSQASDHESPDVIVEEFLEEGHEHALPPTGPELANDRWRNQRRNKNPLFGRKTSVIQWVVVSHIVNPGHFYVRYVAEKRESESLSHKINLLCSTDSCHFTSSDTVETGSMVFVEWKEGVWCRARVVEISRNRCVEAVKVCPVTQLSSVRVFCLDYGLTTSLTIQSEEGTNESSLWAVNNHMRKVDVELNAELALFAPQAIRCSLKDLVPYDLIKGWTEEARIGFNSVVGCAAVEMRPLGQDRDSLLVDLRKALTDQSSDIPMSVREYLVFIEVARFYSPVTLGRKPLLYYPAVYPKINTQLNAVVSHINNPGDFYIQLVENMESVLLSAKLQDCYNVTGLKGEDELTIYCPVIGQACVARYDDKLWYRAQVIGIPGDRKVEVSYVDFGNKNVLSVSDLRKIKDEFFALPSMAIQCCLSDVIPLDGETWSDACTSRFKSLVHQKLVTIVATGKVPKVEPLPVKLFESSLDGLQANIAELLVQEELACFKEGFKPKDAGPPVEDSAIWDPPLELGLTTGGADTTDQGNHAHQNKEQPEFQPELKLSAQLKDIKVKVSHINTPSSFYVQLSQNDSHLRRVCELVKKQCALTEPGDVVWKAGMYCAAYINGVWDRGRISSDVTPGNMAEVKRCDYGNTVEVHVSNLRPLPSSLIGSLALECTLTDIRPAGGQATWTATACDLISYYLAGASAVMTIKELTDERPLPVSLFCSNKMGQFASIADFLTSEGLALRERKPRDAVVEKTKEADAPVTPVSQTGGSDGNKKPEPAPSLIPLHFPAPLVRTLTTPKPPPRTFMSAEKVQTQMYHPPELPGLGHIQITVSAIGDDGLIYARTQNAECQLQQLKGRIQQYMKTLPRQKPYTWKSVQGCAINGPDMLWYRGQLLEVLGGHVKVQYVDCGQVENIPVVHVYPMLLCDDIPQLCVPCQLHAINPVGGHWQRDALALLRKLLQNRCVDMRVMELPADPRGPLTVEVFLDGLSLTRILCHHEHATMDKTVAAQEGHSAMSPAPLLDDWDLDSGGLNDPEEQMLGLFLYPDLPQEGEQFEVRVKHLCTPNELFLWPLGGAADVEVDGETLDEALARINADVDSLPRLTNFPQGGPCLAEYSDGQYYRAKLIKITSCNPVMILVQHVDFGSDDTLPTSKLRQMPAELLRFQSRAIKVKVAGFRAPHVNQQEDVLPYSPGWSVKAAMEMIELLHDNITASVVAREPEFTVLLYNKDGKLVHLPLVRKGLAELT